MFKLPYSANLIGSTIYVKLTAFNPWQGGEQDISTVSPIAIVVPAPPIPALVTGFSVQQNGGPVAFTWTDSADPQGSLKGYDILYGPPGGTVASATLLTESSRTTETTTVSVPPGNWTFYIRGHDIAGGLGAATQVNLTVTNSNIGIVAQTNEPDWLGPSQPSFALDGMAWVDEGTAPMGTFTRSGTTASRTNWQNAVQPTMPANWLRRDFNLLTNSPLGWLLEGPRTNAFRHNDMAGAAAGSPGTAPTNWSLWQNANGLTETVIGTGVEYGMNFIDVQMVGTSTSTAIRVFQFETSAQIAALQGQVWTFGVLVRLTSGSFPSGITLNARWSENDSGGGVLLLTNGATGTPGSTPTIFILSGALQNASTAFLRPGLGLVVPNGTAVNFTVRVYSPQIEQNGFNSSLVRCNGAATTRNADAWSVPVSSIVNWAADRGS